MWIDLKSALNRKQRKISILKQQEDSKSFMCTKAVKEVYPEAGKYIEYKSFQEGVVYISVSDVIWISELNLYKEKIKKNLVNYGFEEVVDIRFTLG